MPLTEKELQKWNQFKKKYKTNSIFLNRVNEIMISINSECGDLRDEVQGAL